MLSLVFAFKIFRQRTNNTKFHEYIVILILGVHITLCTLTNTNNLPSELTGPGVDQFRPNYQSQFFLLVLFSLVSIDKVVVFVAPMYLVAEYFYNRWLQ